MGWRRRLFTGFIDSYMDRVWIHHKSPGDNWRSKGAEACESSDFELVLNLLRQPQSSATPTATHVMHLEKRQKEMQP
jgi:hypothetical protein